MSSLTTTNDDDELLPKGWTKHFSNKHEKWYYHRSSDNTTSWTIPVDNNTQVMPSSSSSSSSTTTTTTTTSSSSSSSSSTTITNDEELPNGWTKVYSDKHEKWYYYNSSDNTSSWTIPLDNNNTQINEKKRNYDNINDDNDDNNNNKKERKNNNIKPYVAIIVPFRDIHIEQKRSQHLERFIPSMISFFNDNDTNNIPYRIYIIEQSNDNRKFNRGKLLNIGYDIAKKDGCEVFVFHDVDLIPSLELINFYTTKPNNNKPVHIARVWNRYSNNEKYFGGIVAFSKAQFEKINGFPNNFWGWGGEDDEMFKRTKKVNFQRISPTSGTIIDLEEMTINDKMKFLKEHSIWKCMNKREVLDEHDATWKTNGLYDLKYQKLNENWRNDHCIVISVDVLENNHWSDLCVGIKDTQLDKSIDELKKEFNKRKH